MATDKQIKANRENAKLSTGPSTEEGKNKVSTNALKHALEARKHIIIGEDQAAFDEYKFSMLKPLEPSNALEEEHALQIISLGWRLRRHSSVEAGLYNQEMIQQMKNGTNRLEVTLLKRRDFEEMVIELDKVPEYQGIAFRRDCKTDNAQDFLTNSSLCKELFEFNASARARAPLSVIRLSTCLLRQDTKRK
jgi:hypothetical protein